MWFKHVFPGHQVVLVPWRVQVWPTSWGVAAAAAAAAFLPPAAHQQGQSLIF